MITRSDPADTTGSIAVPPRRSPTSTGSRIALAATIGTVALFHAAPVSPQTVRGRVVDISTRNAVAAAHIVLVDSTGETRVSASSDSEGFFHFPQLPLGRWTVDVEALGYGAVADRAFLYDGQPLFLEIALEPAPLAGRGIEVSVEAQKPHLRAAGFYERHRVGHGYFLTPDDIAKLTPVRPSDLLRRAPSIRLLNGREPVIARAPGATSFRVGTGFKCVPNLFVDGVAVRIRPELRDGLRDPRAFNSVIPPAEMIEAIEVYPSPATVPGQWKRSTSYCGVIVVWTKH